MKLAMKEALLKHNKEQELRWLDDKGSIPFDQGLLGFNNLSDYVVYSKACEFDVLDDSLGESLDFLDKFVAQIIQTVKRLKSYEKPEGETTMDRGAEIHWRRYPEYSYEDGKLMVSIRILCQHCSISTEAHS